MGQVTLYMDEEFLDGLKTAARRERLSVSKWVKKRLEGLVRDAWPAGYSDLFGSLALEKDFKRPRQPSFSKDVRRERL